MHLDSAKSETIELEKLRRQDTRLKLFYTSTRIGFSGGLNLLASKSSNPFIGRLDADDLSMPWRWKFQLNQIRRADIAFGGLIHSYPLGGNLRFALPHYPTVLSNKQIQCLLVYQNPGFHPSSLIRTEVFEKLNGYRDCISEDYDFWLRAALAGSTFARSLVPVTLYRHHKNQATADPRWLDKVNSDTYISEGQSSLNSYLVSLGMNPRRTVQKLGRTSPAARLEFRIAMRTSR